MTVTTINVTPTWSAATLVYLEVLRVNEWWSEPSKRAREELQRMAQGMDDIQQYVKELKEVEQLKIENDLLRESSEEHRELNGELRQELKRLKKESE